jgi:RHS repeat-associated protein
MTWPDGVQMTYGFDAADRFSSVGAGGASVSAGYDSLSRMTSVVRGGVSTTVGYDNADRMASLAHAFTGGTGNQSWNPIAYTPADQVASVASANSAWDWPGGSASSKTITSDGLNRNAAAGYDCNGNLTYDGTRTFTYDPENRLLTESGPVSMTLAYDPMGRLQQSVIGGATTQFLYDGDALVAEYSGGAVTERYVHGPAADNPVIAFAGPTATTSTASYLLADRQGSIVATANSSGTLTANQTYDAYGVPNAWTGTRFRYTGQIVIPQAQLYYYKARVYDPVAGRFLQTDPVGYGPDVNWYAYVGDDPVNRADSTGNHPEYESGFLGELDGGTFGEDDPKELWARDGDEAPDKPGSPDPYGEGENRAARALNSTEKGAPGSGAPGHPARDALAKWGALLGTFFGGGTGAVGGGGLGLGCGPAAVVCVPAGGAEGAVAGAAVGGTALAGAGAIIGDQIDRHFNDGRSSGGEAPNAAGDRPQVVGGPERAKPNGAYTGTPAEAPSWGAPKPPRPGGAPSVNPTTRTQKTVNTVKAVLDLIRALRGS